LNLQKTTRTTLVEQVALQIQSLIESGEWPVGTRIPPEPELVSILGVSRNTIREAVRAMVHSGLLSTKQGDGTYVCSSSALGVVLQRRIRQSSVLETLELRHALEQKAAQLAANRRTEEDMEAMLRHLRDCDNAAERLDYEAYEAADIRLHQTIVEATHNSIFIELYEHMTEAVQMSINCQVSIMKRMADHRKAHRDVVEAIIERNETKAMAAVHEYIERSKQDLEDKREDDPS